MSYFVQGKGLIGLVLILLLTLGLTRLMLERKKELKPLHALILSFILVCEPCLLAFGVWAVHQQASETASLMIYSYNFLKSAILIYLVFEIPSVVLAWQYYLAPRPESLRLLRFALFMPIVFCAVVFMEAPKMIWAQHADLILDNSLQLFAIVAIVNTILIAFSFKKSLPDP